MKETSCLVLVLYDDNSYKITVIADDQNNPNHAKLLRDANVLLKAMIEQGSETRQ